jgi:hypothetical protein
MVIDVYLAVEVSPEEEVTNQEILQATEHPCSLVESVLKTQCSFCRLSNISFFNMKSPDKTATIKIPDNE